MGRAVMGPDIFVVSWFLFQNLVLLAPTLRSGVPSHDISYVLYYIIKFVLKSIISSTRSCEFDAGFHT
jgi:hypothetical protein